MLLEGTQEDTLRGRRERLRIADVCVYLRVRLCILSSAQCLKADDVFNIYEEITRVVLDFSGKRPENGIWKIEFVLISQ